MTIAYQEVKFEMWLALWPKRIMASLFLLVSPFFAFLQFIVYSCEAAHFQETRSQRPLLGDFVFSHCLEILDAWSQHVVKTVAISQLERVGRHRVVLDILTDVWGVYTVTDAG